MSYLQTIDFRGCSAGSPGEWRALMRLVRHSARQEMIGSAAQQLVHAASNPHTNPLI